MLKPDKVSQSDTHLKFHIEDPDTAGIALCGQNRLVRFHFKITTDNLPVCAHCLNEREIMNELGLYDFSQK